MDLLWRLLRGPFILPENTTKYHQCRWEKIDFDKAGCLVCGGIHKCDAITCKDVSTVDDSLICNVTGCILNKVLVTNQWTDTCLPCVCETKHELTNEIEQYIEELLMSSKTQDCLAHERKKLTESLESKLTHHCSDDANAIDKITIILHKVGGRIPPDFDMQVRMHMVATCMRFISPVVAKVQSSQSFRSFKYNTRQLVFGLIYLMRTGVYCRNETILPKIANLQYLVPRECYLRSFYGMSPSIITDTENKLKYLIRNGYIRSAATRS